MRFIPVSMIVAAAILAGCSSTPQKAPDAASAAPAPVAETAVAPVSTANTQPAASNQPQAKKLPPYLDPANALSQQRSVFFDFDDYTVKKDFAVMVEMHGRFLAQNPSLKIRVEGNADERGGAEYNLALGQKRADAVSKALAIYGVKASQVESTSWGKEKPKALGHDEASWSQNRRVDLVYPDH